ESVTLQDGTTIRCSGAILAASPQQVERLLANSAAPRFVATPVNVAALDIALRRLPCKRAVFAVGVDDPVCFSADSAIVRVAPDAGAVVHLARYLPTGADGTAADERHLEQTLDLLQPGWRELVVYRRFLASVTVSHALVSAASGGFSGRPAVRIPDLENVFL